MLVFKGEGLGSMYYKLIRYVTENGRKVTVRGQDVIECKEPVALVYEKPGHCWMNIPGRRANPFFLLAEVYWILTGRGDVDWIAYYNKRMRDFNDGESENHGAYGLRIRRWKYSFCDKNENGVWSCQDEQVDQIEQVIRKLKTDPFSRQAVIDLWDPVRDNLVTSKDYPCNNTVYYSLRDGVLDQTVVIRSNDLVWGTPTNAVQFTHLQSLVAGELGVKMGTHTYVIQNLHYYFNMYRETLALLIEKAYQDGSLTGSYGDYGDYEDGPGALCIPNFDTVTDYDLAKLVENIDYIYQHWDQKDQIWEPIRRAHFNGSGYWNQTIPQMLWIHRILKEGGNQMPIEDKEYLAVRILQLGSPLVDMVIDFLIGSTIPLNIEIASLCKGLLQTTR